MTRVVEAKRGNQTTILFLVDENGRELFESKQMCVDFQQHFTRLFGTSGETEQDGFQCVPKQPATTFSQRGRVL